MTRSDCPTFESEAADVLSSLRASLTGVLMALPGLRKPADIQKALKIDGTLSWQLFQIAGPAIPDASALSIGAKVPSRSALKRFLLAAESKGVSSAKLRQVWSSFDRFEHLVEAHAGDRTSFISMVSAAAGLDAEWLAADAQHRRNAYRAMSHSFGMQTQTHHRCSVLSSRKDGKGWDAMYIVGDVGLRMLRAIDRTTIFWARRTKPGVDENNGPEPLGTDLDMAGGYLLTEFSSLPRTTLVTHVPELGGLTAELELPPVGNNGVCTTRFAIGYRGIPIPTGAPDDDRFTVSIKTDRPAEVALNDVLIEPGLMLDATLVASVFFGSDERDATGTLDRRILIPGNYRAEYLGKGPDALMTSEVPNYPESLRAIASRTRRDIEDYDAWRLRIEFPLYHSTARLEWKF